jgi:hypothetical protein
MRCPFQAKRINDSNYGYPGFSNVMSVKSLYRHIRTEISISYHDSCFNCRLENVDVQRGKICWRFGSRTLNRYRSLVSISLVSVWEVKFVLFNSMLKYVINRLMHMDKIDVITYKYVIIDIIECKDQRKNV